MVEKFVQGVGVKDLNGGERAEVRILLTLLDKQHVTYPTNSTALNSLSAQMIL